MLARLLGGASILALAACADPPRPQTTAQPQQARQTAPEPAPWSDEGRVLAAQRRCASFNSNWQCRDAQIMTENLRLRQEWFARFADCMAEGRIGPGQPTCVAGSPPRIEDGTLHDTRLGEGSIATGGGGGGSVPITGPSPWITGHRIGNVTTLTDGRRMTQCFTSPLGSVNCF